MAVPFFSSCSLFCAKHTPRSNSFFYFFLIIRHRNHKRRPMFIWQAHPLPLRFPPSNQSPAVNRLEPFQKGTEKCTLAFSIQFFGCVVISERVSKRAYAVVAVAVMIIQQEFDFLRSIVCAIDTLWQQQQ